MGRNASHGWIGRPLRRVEDARLVTGRGCYVDDLRPEGCLYVDFARSPFAAGQITSIDLDAASTAPGVVAVLTGTDVAKLGDAAVNLLVPGMRVPPFPILPLHEVAAVGQPLVAVVADNAAAARDAAQAVMVEFEPRPQRQASPETQTFEQHWRTGDVDAAFASAAHVVRVKIEHARLAPSPLEPRAALADWSDAKGRLTVWLSTQTPHRARTDLARILGLDPEKIRVIAPDVGGAFGGKASLYPEDAVVGFAAQKLGRPVKWTSTRSDDLLAATHARGGVLEGALALAADGRFLALRADITFPLGHWMPFSGSVPARNAARILPGPYAVATADISMRGNLTDTAPLGIYRGAGRPEAAMLMERLADTAAAATGLDPLELRRRNLIGPGQLPAKTPTGGTLDSGDFPGLLVKARELSGYPDLVAERGRRRAAGEVCGVGIAIYVEPCGQGWESAGLRLDPEGQILAATGSTAQGQGRETAFAQIVADALGVHPGRVRVAQGDTVLLPAGIGALASRSTAIGGSALLKAAEGFRDKVLRLAGQLLQAAPESLALSPEGCRADGVHRLSWAEIGAAAHGQGTGADQAGLATSLELEAKGEAWASGACVAFLSVEPDTGMPDIERLVWVDDAGRVVNPLLAEGQLVGGMAQGLGEALMERLVYDEDGQLVTGSFMDYQMPRAADIPPLTLGKLATPSPMNLLGAKGVGEAGCIGIPAAVVNAVVDALSPFGVRHLDMPLTSAKIWHAMQPAPGGRTAPGGQPASGRSITGDKS